MKVTELAEMIAPVAHNVIKAYCESINDDSIPKWEDAPEWQRKGTIYGVQMHLNNPDITPEDSHNEWMKSKEEDGWVYGEKKDPDSTPPTHPSLIPFDDLPKLDKVKDYLFKTVVDSLIEA